MDNWALVVVDCSSGRFDLKVCLSDLVTMEFVRYLLVLRHLFNKPFNWHSLSLLPIDRNDIVKPSASNFRSPFRDAPSRNKPFPSANQIATAKRNNVTGVVNPDRGCGRAHRLARREGNELIGTALRRRDRYRQVPPV